MDLSILIPCKREEGSIASCLERTIKTYPDAEILVIDSGLDATLEIVKSFQKNSPALHYVRCDPDRGKGDAIRQGIEKSSRALIAQIDADLQFFPEDLPMLIKPLLQDKADMVLGSRFMKDSYNESSLSLRSLGNQVVSQWTSWLFGQEITDALAGIKAWKREVTQTFTLNSYNFSYEVELFAKAIRKGFRITDVAVRYQNRKEGESKVHLLKAGCLILKDSLKFRYVSL